MVNYNTFHLSYPVAIPLCSAQALERRRVLRQLGLEGVDVDVGQDVDGDDWDEEDVEYSVGAAGPVQDARAAATNAEAKSPSESQEGKEGIGLTAGGGDSTPTQRGGGGGSRAEEAAAAAAEAAAAGATTTNAGGTTTADAKDGEGEGEGGKQAAPAKERVRKTSRVEFQALPAKAEGGGVATPQRRLSVGDAVNMYRHRRSVTDTYLGTELSEEESDDSEQSAAILTIVSQQSRVQQDRRPDVRDVFKLRRKSTTQELMFGTEGGDNDWDSA